MRPRYFGNMSETKKLLAEIDTFLAWARLTDSTFGHHSVNDGKLLQRLRAGGTVTIDTAAAIRAYIEAETKLLKKGIRRRRGRPQKKAA
jgi:hypothetical protein